MEVAGFVAVDDERARAALGGGIGRRLGSALEVPLLAVGVDRFRRGLQYSVLSAVRPHTHGADCSALQLVGAVLPPPPFRLRRGFDEALAKSNAPLAWGADACCGAPD
jgi:hypothetical protein